MALDDTQSILTEERVFARQNLFSSIYQPPVSDAINVNVYQDFAYSKIGSSNNFLMTTGVNVVINHFFELGPFCTYLGNGKIVQIEDPDKGEQTPKGTKKDKLRFDSYFYCGAMFAYVPLANKIVHPKAFLDVGLGGISGVAEDEDEVRFRKSYSFIVLKPAIAAEINLLSFLQWTAAVQYRFQVGLGNESQKKVGRKTSGIEASTGIVLHF